MKLAK